MNADTAGVEGELQEEHVTKRVIGAFYEAYNEVGFGFIESVYQEALAITLTDAEVEFVREPTLSVQMRHRTIGIFRPDFLVEKRVIVELKVAREIEERHRVRVLNYLRASSVEVALILNFGPRPQFQRLVFANSRKVIRVHLR